MINYVLLGITFTIALAFSYFLTPLMRVIALRLGILSKPGKRMVHTKSIPFLGGIAIYFAFVISIFFVCFVNPEFRIEFCQQIKGLLIAGALVVILGLCDDAKGINPLVKLSGQVAIALLLFGYGFRVEVFTNPLTGVETHLPFLLSIFITISWIVGLVNAMNLIDGLDGLAAGITVIVAGSLLFIDLFLANNISIFLLAALAGSALGFLRFNFFPAKIFMGDTGSMFIGLALASIALVESQHKSSTATVLLVPITALIIPIYDTVMAFFRRLLKKGSIFKADKKHLHHRLLSTGLTQKQIVPFIYLITLYLGIFAFLFVLIPNKYALTLLFLLALGLFLATRVIGFIEKNARLLHRLELKRRKVEV
ncbi:MAG: MraY family glycosyltransferase [Candidatus Omnitrophota bacterium]